jgi:hypothetical protein
MPESYSYFKQEVKQYFQKHIPTTTRILDVGPGIGTYALLLRDLGYKMDCVEIWEPYVTEYGLKDKYDNVYVGSILDIDISEYDYIILGDVLEHIGLEDAQKLISKIHKNKIECLVAVPYQMEQGEYYGNIYESHLQPDLTRDNMLTRYPELDELFYCPQYGYYTNRDKLKHERAYVLYANENYFDTVQACVNSIRAFSKLPIYVYLLNCDKKVEGAETINWKSEVGALDNSNFIKEKDNFYIDRSKSKIFDLLIKRPLIVKDALQNYAQTVCYVDSDSVATSRVDTIFDFYDPKKTHPYFVEGIYEYLLVNGRGGAENKETLHTTLEHPACELFNVDQRVREKYRQTGYFVAGKNTVDFLDEWYWMCNHPKVLNNPTWYAPYHEETIANVLLWKYNIQEGLPYIYVNGGLSKIDKVYSELEFTGEPRHIEEWFRIPGNKKDILFFHGEKNSETMSRMVEKIKTYNNNVRKLVYIAPHLSTGGQPQYALKQIQEFSKDFDIYVIEYNYNSAHFIVQRDQIVQTLGSKFYSLGDDKTKLIDIINKIQPDIVHLHEVPEFFMSDEVAVELFNKDNRDYFIVTTTHSSLTTPSALRFYPDKFVLVSKWSQQKFQSQLPEIPTDIWEYPIDRYFKDQKLAQKLLDLDPEYKHVLNVGLFTPGKNQGEIFEIARQIEDKKIKFHFVGNQAGNFEEYWKPLMENVPSNCIVWGERNDVHNFYQACDVFYFSSKFELNPLSIKEALSYGMPCMFRKLETYLDTYDNNPLVTYIDDNLERTKHLLLR